MANALAPKNKNLLSQAIVDPEYWSMVRQGLTDSINRGLIGGIVGAPVDIANMALKPFGYGSERPVMGSEWIGQQMQNAGLVSGNRNALAEGLASFIDPATIGAGAAKLAGTVPAIVGMAKSSGRVVDAIEPWTNKFSRVLDTFGNGKDIKYYDDASGLYIHKRTTPKGQEVYSVGEMGYMDGEHKPFLDQPIVQGETNIFGTKLYDSPEAAISAIKGQKISAGKKAANAAYSSIPSTWKGQDREIAKRIIDEFGNATFKSSARSESKYIVTPGGMKIRVSSHDLPPQYEGADVDFRHGGNIDDLIRQLKGD